MDSYGSEDKDAVFDVAIIGAGLVGLLIAYELSRYRLEIAVIDLHPEPGFGVSRAHGGVIHVIQLPLGSVKSRLAIYGNRMYDRLCRELGVGFRRVSAILVAQRVRQLIYSPILYLLLKLYYGARGFGVRLVGGKTLRRLEPNIVGFGGVVVDGYGIVDSFRLIYNLYHELRRRKIRFFLETRVTSIRVLENYIALETSRGTIGARFLVNSAGLSSSDIAGMVDPEYRGLTVPKPGAMIVFDRTQTRNIVAPIHIGGGETKGGGIIPTLWGTTIWGPNLSVARDRCGDRCTSTCSTPRDLFTLIERFSGIVRVRGTPVKLYVGVRPSSRNGDFHIGYSKRSRRIVNLIGIESPGLTAAPAIAKIVVWMLWRGGLELRRRRRVVDHERSEAEEPYRDIETDPGDERDIVCPCMGVSMAHLKEAVAKGVSTLDGLCFYTRLGMGACQGQNCLGRAIVELSRLLNIDPRKLRKGYGDSWVVK